MSKLVENWQRVIILSISFWAQVAGLLFLIVPEIVYLKKGIDTNPVLLWWIGVLLLIFGLFGRLFRQKHKPWVEWLRMSAVMVVIISVSMLASSNAFADERDFINVAAPLVAKWEGKENHAYYDKLPKNHIWTVCYGETRGVKEGDYYTDSECLQKLEKALLHYRSGLHRYFNCETKRYRLSANRDAVYTSLAYNAGIRAIGRSTATRRLNAGDIVGGCKAIGWWNKAGGRVIRGLVNRRSEEVQLCLIGV